ncbi:ATP-binding cassette domain-containing protein [Allofrancisella guangzhouensis]|uniref:Cell division ATP-binding protein FtsE n=1 Tax=Allofrancisella guangzhouensis TaxID=594679 RepID=A0A0A8E5A8_9GAMM|nr:ATP-binding cassette domain-containing protein [Allofrancisella guangzhouensis]AJC48792.1 methionine ABC transporter ATP-binding protein [Allofrancisella guangzhouensis]MBK2028014.1 ATP-binding cassette domain-containing protein [Allofrancisella guangzhouensis]MBK2044404.1 ATP-binding cassette domain-containing protein [Allofrancisella guangzhouensis]MBK2045290.1 ATP-binding cassette domain-containing protein [Allofrancisella guangzhouensis]
MIEIKNLKKEYITNNISNLVLDNISLEIKEGEIFGIIGHSGAGKSSLLRCLNLLEQPSDGSIFIADENITKKNPKQLREFRKKIAMIFQHFNLLSSRNVFENIALPLEIQGIPKSEIKKRVYELLDLVELPNKVLAYPKELSGGQKQKVAIARALALNPLVLLSDEATSALDPTSTKQILALLKRLNKELDLTIVLITHEMDVVRKVCDRVAIIDKGQIAEIGKTLDIFLNPQTEVTKSFVETSIHTKVPEFIAKRLYDNPYSYENAYPIVQLTFYGEKGKKPIIAEVSRQFNANVSIIQANIETIQDQIVGIAICHITGERQDWENALRFLSNQDVNLKVLGYAPADNI